MANNKTVNEWMEENGLTTLELANAVRYSTGAVSKWRQQIVFPSPRTEKAIRRAQMRRGWTPFPQRPV